MRQLITTLFIVLTFAAHLYGAVEVGAEIPVILPDFQLKYQDGNATVAIPEGFYAASVGEPELPWNNIFVSDMRLDSTATPFLEILRADTIILAAPLSSTRPPVETRDTVLSPNDSLGESAVGAFAEYPVENCRIESSTLWQGQQVLSLSWCPFRYFPKTNTLIVIREGHIHFGGLDSQTGLGASHPSAIRFNSYQDLRQLPDIQPPPSVPAIIDDQMRTIKTGIPLDVEYLIITTKSLAAAFMPLARWRLQQGYRVGIGFVDQLVSAYPGEDTPARIRAYLAEAHSRGLQFCVLGGDETIVPIRYAYHGYSDEKPGYDRLQICDLFYADFTGDWDTDGDGVYGEYLQDNADLFPEIYLGRLLAANATQVTAIVDKIIAYESNPGAGNPSYVTRALFTCSDHMRDWDNGYGQHAIIAEQFPNDFYLDLNSQSENPNGSMPDPQAPEGADFINFLGTGWGWITLVNHGRADGFIVRAAGLNQNPRSYIWADGSGADGNGYINLLPENHRPGIFLSVTCDGGAFDMDGPSFNNDLGLNAGEALLHKPAGGAVAIMAYSRWGWVASSYRLAGKIAEYAFDPAFAPQLGVAFALAKANFPYYRDQNLGLNLYGDPAMLHWTAQPRTMQAVFPAQVRADSGPVQFNVGNDNGPLSAAMITATYNDTVFFCGTTDAQGIATWSDGPQRLGGYTITITQPGYLPLIRQLIVPIATDIFDDQDETGLPQLSLGQNYPNPFNPATIIEFALPAADNVRLEVFDILGHRVATLLEHPLPAGRHQVAYTGTDDAGSSLPSGMYFYRLQAGDASCMKKMVMLK